MDLDQVLFDVRKLPTSTDSDKGFKGLMFGVIYALRHAGELGFRNRTGAMVGPDYSAELDEAGVALTNHQQMPRDWLAGFYFNSALVRITGGSHRAFRRLFKTSKGWFSELADRAISDGKLNEQEIDWLRKVYEDVNAFKHDGHAELLQRRQIETLQQGINAAGQLVRLINKAV